MTVMPEVPEPVEWITRAEAARRLGRSRRTIRRWAADEDIRTRKAPDLITQLLAWQDVRRVEARKSAYIEAPTFGRHANPANVDTVR